MDIYVLGSGYILSIMTCQYRSIFDGEITLIAGDVRQTAKGGTLVYIPAGCVHTFRVDSETARVLNFYLPGGFEGIIPEFGTPAQSRTVPPSELHESGTPDQKKAVLARVGMHIVALPDVLRAERGRS